ncbi:MAG: hypothetical protein ACM3UU_10475 [Ignavibacteriales bacterium]
MTGKSKKDGEGLMKKKLIVVKGQLTKAEKQRYLDLFLKGRPIPFVKI